MNFVACLILALVPLGSGAFAPPMRMLADGPQPWNIKKTVNDIKHAVTNKDSAKGFKAGRDDTSVTDDTDVSDDKTNGVTEEDSKQVDVNSLMKTFDERMSKVNEELDNLRIQLEKQKKVRGSEDMGDGMSIDSWKEEALESEIASLRESFDEKINRVNKSISGLKAIVEDHKKRQMLALAIQNCKYNSFEYIEEGVRKSSESIVRKILFGFQRGETYLIPKTRISLVNKPAQLSHVDDRVAFEKMLRQQIQELTGNAYTPPQDQPKDPLARRRDSR